MRLADFIVANMQAIVAEWEAFASTLLPAASSMTSLALRDHAEPILEAVAKDLRTHQTREEQVEKSKGRAPLLANAPETAAQTHAVLRVRSGFDINQLVAEYRALRASVLRLWMDAVPPGEFQVRDMVRFNEAIDQAIAESVGHFHQLVETHRNLLLGMLGHDMRNPLNAILMTADHLARMNGGGEITEAAERLVRSGASMQRLLDDLTDFNRTNLGLGLRIAADDVDLGSAVRDELQQFYALYPGRDIRLTLHGNPWCWCDRARMQQVLRNLVSNALKYGGHGQPVGVAVRGETDHVWLEVENAGTLDDAEIHCLFDPLRRGRAGRESGNARDGLGLGLFIVQQIARAHGGEVAARCSGGKTLFIVRLPRTAVDR